MDNRLSKPSPEVHSITIEQLETKLSSSLSVQTISQVFSELSNSFSPFTSTPLLLNFIPKFLKLLKNSLNQIDSLDAYSFFIQMISFYRKNDRIEEAIKYCKIALKLKISLIQQIKIKLKLSKLLIIAKKLEEAKESNQFCVTLLQEMVLDAAVIDKMYLKELAILISKAYVYCARIFKCDKMHKESLTWYQKAYKYVKFNDNDPNRLEKIFNEMEKISSLATNKMNNSNIKPISRIRTSSAKPKRKTNESTINKPKMPDYKSFISYSIKKKSVRPAVKIQSPPINKIPKKFQSMIDNQLKNFKKSLKISGFKNFLQKICTDHAQSNTEISSSSTRKDFKIETNSKSPILNRKVIKIKEAIPQNHNKILIEKSKFDVSDTVYKEIEIQTDFIRAANVSIENSITFNLIPSIKPEPNPNSLDKTISSLESALRDDSMNAVQSNSSYSSSIQVELPSPNKPPIPLEARLLHSPSIRLEAKSLDSPSIRLEAKPLDSPSIPLEAKSLDNSSAPANPSLFLPISLESNSIHSPSMPLESSSFHTRSISLESNSFNNSSVPLDPNSSHSSPIPLEPSSAKSPLIPSELTKISKTQESSAKIIQKAYKNYISADKHKLNKPLDSLIGTIKIYPSQLKLKISVISKVTGCLFKTNFLSHSYTLLTPYSIYPSPRYYYIRTFLKFLKFSNEGFEVEYRENFYKFIKEKFDDKDARIIHRSCKIIDSKLYQIIAFMASEELVDFIVTSSFNQNIKFRVDVNSLRTYIGIGGLNVTGLVSYAVRSMLVIRDPDVCYLDMSRNLDNMNKIVKIQALIKAKLIKKRFSTEPMELIYKTKAVFSGFRFTVLIFRKKSTILIRLVKGFDVIGLNLDRKALEKDGLLMNIHSFYHKFISAKVQVSLIQNKFTAYGLEKYINN
jgi:hypothetical protein